MRDVNRILSDWYGEHSGQTDFRLSISRHFDCPVAWAYQDHPTYFVTVRDSSGHRRTETVLKICSTEELAREEFQALVELDQHFRKQDGRFGVPIPIAVFPSIPGLLMSRASGERLSKILRQPGIGATKPERKARILDGIRRTASWLVAFQRMPCHKEGVHKLGGPADVDGVQDHLHTLLELCREHGMNPHPSEVIQEWFSTLRDSLADLRSTCVPICDFQPTHVFLSETQTSVIDFEEPNCGWPGENLASFLVYCQVYWNPIVPTAIPVEKICRTFLESYVSQVKFGLAHQMSLEVAFVLDLLDTYLRPWTDKEQRWTKQKVSYWRSWLAKREIAKRTSTGTWQTIVRENW